jgi:hypothetical protein
MRLARSCPDRGTSHALEALSVEFMERAAEIDLSLTLLPAESSDRAADG